MDIFAIWHLCEKKDGRFKRENMKLLKFVFIILITIGIGFLISCTGKGQPEEAGNKDKTWADKLGYPTGKKVIILHADDAGMCEEANIAAFNYLSKGEIQSAAGMPPCEWFDEYVTWANANPNIDLGIHLTLTSEWQKYRWGPVSNPEVVPGLIDPDGFLWHEVPDVARHASAKDVEKEIRTQIEKAISLGMKIDHIDTHMGTLFGRTDYTIAYINAAQDYGVPAMVISLTDDEVLKKFQSQGYPINEDTQKLLAQYTLPQLDDFHSVPSGKTYKAKLQKFYQLVKSLRPGLTEIIFHPSVETENLKSITNAWQQRVWEAEMFSDPDVIQFFEDEEVVFTNWIEIMDRHSDAK